MIDCERESQDSEFRASNFQPESFFRFEDPEVVSMGF